MREASKGHGTSFLYEVEVRTTYDKPQQHPFGFIVDSEWRKVPTEIVQCTVREHGQGHDAIRGIPVQTYPVQAMEHGLLDFNAAYTFSCLVQTLPSWKGFCLQTRLVRVKFTHSYAIEVDGYSEPFSMAALDRPSLFTKPEESASFESIRRTV